MGHENRFFTIDFGCHHYPELPPESEFIHSFIEDADGEEICTDTEVFLDRYRSAGIDAAVLSQPFFMGHADADRTSEANDGLLDVVHAHEEFYGLAAIPTAAGGEVAAAELERCLDRGYHGGAIETKSDGVEPIDPSLDPVFDVAEEYGAPILVHPKLDDSLHSDLFTDVGKGNAVFGRETALAASIYEVIHSGVLDRHPDLRLVYHHNGGNIASMLPRVRLQLDEGRWPGLDGLKSYDEFVSQFEDHIYLDTAGYYGDRSTFRRTLEELPASNLLFATDFPYETRAPDVFRDIVSGLEDISSDTDSEKILGGNALDILANT